MERSRTARRWIELAALALLALVVTVVWCTVSNRWTSDAWRTPAVYGGDAWWGLAYTKCLVDGEVPLVLPKYPKSLGAPFRANWNDYPSVEEGALAWCALLAHVFGNFSWQHAAALSAHLLAAACFYFVCRYLRYDPLLSLAAAILFAFSRYAVSRGVAHLSLTLYWHVPLGLLVVWWCAARAPFEFRSKKMLAAVAIAVAHGAQNPYYTGLFLQFLAWAAFICLLQRRTLARTLIPVALCVVVFATFALMNLDTFYSNQVHGSNPATVNRAYAGIELYALKPLELVLPASHRITALQAWSKETYFKRALFIGEGGSPYLGLIGIIALAALGWKVAASIASRSRPVPTHFWYILWILLYSVVGGVNGFLGAFGMVLYRATNRYSIVILALVLMFLVRELSRLTRSWRWPGVAVIAAVVTCVGLWDQIALVTTAAEVESVRATYESDRQLAKRMEKKLPSDAMVFQLPVMDYPEVEPLVDLSDYEQFRPFLHSWDLRFSYGSTKGRARERWQREAERLGPPALISILERYGFSAVLVARKGYADRGAAILTAFNAAGRGRKIAESADFVCLALEPSPDPLLPPEFDQRWSGLEGAYKGNWRWSSGDATIVLHHLGNSPKDVRVTFGLGTLKPRQAEVQFGGKSIANVALLPNEQPAMVDTTLTLLPGENRLEFRTDTPAEVPGNGDPRKLALRLTDFSVSH